MRVHSRSVKVLSILLVISFVLSACTNKTKKSASSYKKQDYIDEEILDEETFVEDEIGEDIFSEYYLDEYITEEIYLEEIVLAENTITELLLEEESIEDVQICKTTYVSEDHIEDFAENSQTNVLCEDTADLKALLTEVSLGTGVIVTLVVLKKVGQTKLIRNIVASAAPKSIQFAKGGAIVGSLFGAFTGATDEIDPSGTISSIFAFATATAFLIFAALNIATPVSGFLLVIAAVQLVGTAVGTILAGEDMILKLTSTDMDEIEWDSIDWKAVGASAARKAIKSAGEGYMWGAIIGAGIGSLEGFHKYYAPHSDYKARLASIPAEDSKIGHWKGKRGESKFVLNDPIKLDDGTVIKSVNYQNGIPDFSKYAEAEVKISRMTDKRLGAGNNYNQADEALAKQWTQDRYQGQKWNAGDVRAYREANGLTWHEMNNMEYMQLVPYEVNRQFTHLGGVSEYKTMIGYRGEDYD